MDDIRSKLESKTKHELQAAAKRLGIASSRHLRKHELINKLMASASPESNPTHIGTSRLRLWWHRHSNHVYGVATIVGLLLTAISLRICASDTMADYATSPSPHYYVSPIEPPQVAALLPLTINQLLHEVQNGALTELQRSTIIAEYCGQSVQWSATVRSVEDLPGTDGEILMIVSSMDDNIESFLKGVVPVRFASSERDTLHRISKGARVEFTATIASFGPGHVPQLRSGRVIRVID
jgi:hypothetical protein